MKIQKIGHACFMVEEKGVRVLFDPGDYASGYEHIHDLAAIVITHEHKDHVSTEALRGLLSNNSSVRVITHEGVQKMLSSEGIVSELVGSGDRADIRGISLEGFLAPHAEIYGPISVQNTAYLLGEKLFHPGDSFMNPQVPVEVLALPAAGPWMKVGESVAYALALRPRVAFPIHDGMLRVDRAGSHYRVPENVLSEAGIRYVSLKDGETFDV